MVNTHPVMPINIKISDHVPQFWTESACRLSNTVFDGKKAIK